MVAISSIIQTSMRPQSCPFTQGLYKSEEGEDALHCHHVTAVCVAELCQLILPELLEKCHNGAIGEPNDKK